MVNKTSQHILNAAATLLGFCLFVITSLQFLDPEESTLIDEVTSIIAVFLATSCTLSFLSIKSSKEQRGRRLETLAEYCFITALIGILIVILLISFNFLN